MGALQSQPPGGDSWLPMQRSTRLDCGSACTDFVSLLPAPNRLQAWFAGLVAFEKARVLKCKVASRTAFDTGLTHRQWPEIG